MLHPERTSSEELAARNTELVAVVADQAALIETLRAEVAALRRWRPGPPALGRGWRSAERPVHWASRRGR
jgi:hypothetical protein